MTTLSFVFILDKSFSKSSNIKICINTIRCIRLKSDEPTLKGSVHRD